MKKNKERNVIEVRIMVPAVGKSGCDLEGMCMYACVSSGVQLTFLKWEGKGHICVLFMTVH